jgi:hypothetical protein
MEFSMWCLETIVIANGKVGEGKTVAQACHETGIPVARGDKQVAEPAK